LLITINLRGRITKSHYSIIFEQLETRFFYTIMIQITEIIEKISSYCQLSNPSEENKDSY